MARLQTAIARFGHEFPRFAVPFHDFAICNQADFGLPFSSHQGGHVWAHRENATCGLVQIDETGLCLVLAEAAPTGGQATKQKTTAGALSLVVAPRHFFCVNCAQSQCR